MFRLVSFVVTALLLGLSFGAEADLIAFFCGHHFGLRNYGFLYAVVYGVFNLAVAAGLAVAERRPELARQPVDPVRVSPARGRRRARPDVATYSRSNTADAVRAS